MNTVLADTGYWIASINPKDQYHEKAGKVTSDLGHCRIVTSEIILVEFLNAMSGFGKELRRAAYNLTISLRENVNVDIEPATSAQIREASDYYSERPDKSWSLTDCSSFLLMQKRNISEALSADHHFTQAGYKALF